ncbi:respiratory nitrate reductase chaperone NarJ [Rhizobiales bacterium GAS113]|nr:respiratory nitrate reductase chaperone NarJ [Rhizobiales bacterium GAS113]
MIVLRAFSALLSYPRDELMQALPELAGVVRTSPLVAPRERRGLLALIDELAQGELLEMEERYVELFDRGRATSLNLFEHLHGEGRERGDAMVELKRHYERAGFELSTRELPDYLPVVLEYLSCRDLAETKDMLSDCAHILKKLGTALLARRSTYAAVPQALLVIAGEEIVDAASVPATREKPEALDREWFEEPAFAGAPTAAGPTPGSSQ